MRLATIFCALIFFGQSAFAQDHALAMHGAPQLAADFTHYNYASPNALQERTLKQAQIGSFDSLNPFSIRGNAAKNIRERVFESLLDRHYDEPFALYGLLAERGANRYPIASLRAEDFLIQNPRGTRSAPTPVQK